MNTPAPAFTTWSFQGVHFIAVPTDRAFHILDANGQNYGAWLDVDSFRKRQQAKDETALIPLGTGRLGVWTN